MRYFNLFSNILVTKGIRRILISDLQRNISELYPLELYEMIEELKKKSIENLISDYDDESKETVQEYLNILLEKEYGFITDKDWDRNFPPLSFGYHEPSVITDIFLEIENIDVIKKISSSIENLGGKHLTIYSTTSLTTEDFIKIDKIFKTSVLSGIEIFSLFHEDVDKLFIDTVHKNTKRIYQVTFYSCKRKPFKVKDEFRFSLYFTEEEVKISSCGKVDLKYFNTNISKVSEAIHHNSCLHKKIGIDIHGNIKNCPLMSESFGNINNSSLEEAVLKTGFKKYWNITKDHIEVCRDCEFRYICTDCRAYTERTHKNNDGLDVSKPLKCGYDPYTGNWEAWSKNPLKQTAIHYYEQNNSKA
ncbi:grasp-with-spasm system SPASM domain peptide maturase [Chryseobacterium sp. W4I1]|uniref:grasp-with-spasm system SPASM domain peptide maturase n=1 Tax=Chryseobacterium sp. W4I1 TaxID=3042293 RepID=UPI0027810072|nr:grasp-with-spasm system SPASM domain peptide maturase [Chryseobacterium sp. W4I1]MDQ0780387.1 SPASM domain peptide maturase of grasp-with-spasm system [Chryseobacterium sp. W4I1]